MKRTKITMAGFLAVGAMAMTLAAAGCGNKTAASSSGSSNGSSVTSYQKAAEGGKMTPSQHDAMMAAIAQRQTQQAAQQSKEAQMQHVPGRG